MIQNDCRRDAVSYGTIKVVGYVYESRQNGAVLEPGGGVYAIR